MLASADTDLPLFEATDGTVTAGDVRTSADTIMGMLRPRPAPVYVYTKSASLFAASLLATAGMGRSVGCPANIRPDYLEEIGAQESDLLTDEDVSFPTAKKIALMRARHRQTRSFDYKPDIDLLFYTSGVTGAPKLVSKGIGLLDAESLVLEELWGKEAAGSKVQATVSHQHIYGMLFRLFWPITAGMLSSDRAAEYWEHLPGMLMSGATIVSSPAHLSRLPVTRPVPGANPKLIFSSGAPLGAAAAEACRNLFGSLPTEVLGSTETGGIAWRRQDHPDNTWTTLPRVHVTADRSGRLMVTSPFTGHREPIPTGDIVEIRESGFVLKGRSDRIAKVEGKRVSLVRVEQALLAHQFVKDAAVVDLPSRKGALGAIVELNDDGEKALSARGSFRLSRSVRGSLSRRLDQSERPKYWRFESVPRNAQGKAIQSTIRAAFDTPPARLFGRGRVKAIEAENATIELEIIPTLVWFSGHFPNEPVLPGLAQIHMAAAWTEHAWRWKPVGSSITKLKFRRVLRPGDRVLLKLARRPALGRVTFSYHLDGVVASEGTIGSPS